MAEKNSKPADGASQSRRSPLTKKTTCGFTSRQINRLYKQLSTVITPAPELHFSSAFELLIAVLLSAQCTDKAVNKVTEQLWKTLHTPQDFINLGQTALEEAIHSLGFYHTKAKHIIELCASLLEKHNGEVPDSFEELTALSGVGTKTANVVLNLWFGHPTIPVDTHIFRVAHRTGLSNAPTPEAVERELESITPVKYARDAHHLLLLHGRYTCKSRKPDCEQCPIADLCPKNSL